jgi:VacB/RNase II family 3'-5' exoribonuclease
LNLNLYFGFLCGRLFILKIKNLMPGYVAHFLYTVLYRQYVVHKYIRANTLFFDNWIVTMVFHDGMTSFTTSKACSTPWIHRSFDKDAKLRTRERYWRHIHITTTETTADPLEDCDGTPLVLPDATTLRIYAPVLQELYAYVTIVLLESVAEQMDLFAARCPPAPRERSFLLQTIRSKQFSVFCDLSVKLVEHDDWDWMNFETLTLHERSQHALIRAARILRRPTTWLVVSGDGEDLFTSNTMVLDDGVVAMSIDSLLQMLVKEGVVDSTKIESLEALKQACDDEYKKRNPVHVERGRGDQVTYAEIYSSEQIKQGLANKTLVRGRLNVTKENPREAFVKVGSAHYYIEQSNLNRAFHQDTVILIPLPPEEWGRPVGKDRIVNYNKNANENDDGDDIPQDLTVPPVLSGRIVQVELPCRRVFVATMIDAPRDSTVLVVPMDVRIPKIRVRARADYIGVRLKVQVDAWDVCSSFPHGRVIQILGPVGDLETEVAALLLENQVELAPFSTSALACLPSVHWAMDADEIQRRRDLRSIHQIFSVDPPGCQDIDDAMHAMELPNGDIEFGVHIADVTHFVQHNSPLDKEAQIRGTTFYLVDRRFDMLPSLLSGNLCSLHGQSDRYAVSVIWILSSDLKDIKSTWYGRTVIRNCAALTYNQADNILQNKLPDAPRTVYPPPLTAGGPVDPALHSSLKTSLSLLTRFARSLRRVREEVGGAVDLTSGDLGTELKFTLVDGIPTQVKPKADKEIHHTIAELMIAANTSVATKIYECFPDSALLRTHRAVEENRFEDLQEILEKGGIAFDGKNSMAVAKSLKDAETGTNAIVNALFKSLTTRAMSEALYVCPIDDKDGAGFSHYGLGLEKYTHFTSPIRRYADIVVHKQLLAALFREQNQHEEKKTPALNINVLESLPESNVISILAGDGISDEVSDDDDMDFLDSMIEGAAELALGGPFVQSMCTEERPRLDEATGFDEEGVANLEYALLIKPYGPNEVSQICQGLNLHHRLAKYSSTECQRLFLSLYFRNNAETTEAVVVNLRSNGFWVFVPRFDLRCPVFVKDTSNEIQMDPELFGLPAESGLEPTLGFAGSSNCRRFPMGACELITGSKERLEITLPGSARKFVVRSLDVITVELTCDNWDVRSRVPLPRAQLVAATSNRLNSPHSKSSSTRQHITSNTLKAGGGSSTESEQTLMSKSPQSVFDVLSSFRVKPVLDVPLRFRDKTSGIVVDRNETIRGRLIYRNFINPDTRVAQQEAAQQGAAAEAVQRRTHALEQNAKNTEYDRTKRIEREVLARQSRLFASKRSTKMSKAKSAR